jgi:hypothetical protein
MRKILHDRLFRRLFLAGSTALGGAAIWQCGTSTKPSPTATVASALDSASVFTQHNDNARTGANLAETSLTPTSVSTKFGYLYDMLTEGVVYAQPLVASNVTMFGTVYPTVVYVVTMHNLVYAFDGSAPTPRLIVTRQLETATAAQDLIIGNCNCFSNTCLGDSSRYNCFGTQRPTANNIPGEIGILSTPVIVNGTMYLISNTGAGTQNQHILHALDIATLDDISAPQVVTHPGGTAFPSYQQIQRPALLAANGMVYAAFASYCDAGPYNGWVIGLDGTTLKATSEWEAAPTSTKGAGIWQSGQGPAADSDGDVYVLTGNGFVDSDTNIILGAVPGANNAAAATVKLGPPPNFRGSTRMAIADWFVPSNYQYLNGNDLDPSSAGVLLVPSLNLAIGGGKFGTLYIAPQNALGRFSSSGTPPGVQALLVGDAASAPAASNAIKGSPVYWDGPNGPQIYVWAANDFLKAFHYNGAAFDATPAQRGAPAAVDPGGILSISANGGSNGIVWAARTIPSPRPVVFCPQQGGLMAFDASDLGHVLWDSAFEVSSDGFVFSKNAPPSVANGRVFVSTFGALSNIAQQPPQDGAVRVFGLGAVPQGFGASTAWFDPGITFSGALSPTLLANPTQLADVDGDGKADAVAFNGATTWVMLSSGSKFSAPGEWSSTNFYGTHDAYSTWLGDVDGINGADAVAFDGTSVYVMLSNGKDGFKDPAPWSGPGVSFFGALSPTQLANPTQLADVNGDGKADAVAFDGISTRVMLSNGAGFDAPTVWSNTNFYGTYDAHSTWLADVDGISGADAVAFDGTSVYVMLSNGKDGFKDPALWSGPGVSFFGTLGPTQLANPTQLADVNGDGKADAVAFDGTSTWVMLSNGAGFNPPILWSNTNFYGTHDAYSTSLGDVNDDGLADAVAFDGSNAYVMLGAR